jgi:uncharacterized protein (TIGR00255 family)
MFQSMTAYGRAHVETKEGRFLIEIHSVNRRSLDIAIYLPKELLFLDIDLRKRLSEVANRGYVTIRIMRETTFPPSAALLDKKSMKALCEEWGKVARELGYDPKEAIPFPFLLEFVMSEGMRGKSISKEEFLKGFEKAAHEWAAMKKREGNTLLQDVKGRLRSSLEQVKKIEKLSVRAPEKYRQKLWKRLEEIKAIHAEDEERLSRELIIFSDKIDITEEIVRLKSHFEQFSKVVSSKEKGVVGRELDFLIQEMNREVNTIAAKSQDLAITESTLFIKRELEKVREQIQNVE